MTEQIPTSSPTQPEEQKISPQARRSDAPTRQRTQRHLHSSGRFSEAALRWPERRAIALPTSVEDWEPTHAGLSRDGLRSLLAALDAPPGHGWAVPAIRRRPAIPRGHGPPGLRLKLGTELGG